MKVPAVRMLISDVRTFDYERKLKGWLVKATIDVLINNAGSGSEGSSIETATTEKISQAF